MKKMLSSIGSIVGIMVLAVMLMVSTKTGFVIIDGWEVGVKKTGTSYNMEELQPGYKLFIPMYEEITEINTRPILFNYTSNVKNKKDTEEIRYNPLISGVDKNGIPISFALAIEVRPVRTMMSEMFQSDGTFENGISKKVIEPNKSVVRDVMGMFDAKTIQSNRDQVSAMLNEKIKDVYKENRYFELVGSVDLKQIDLPQKVRDRQIEVQLAAQDAERSAELIVKAENEAKAEAAKAQGIADRKRIEAQGIADAILMEAEAQAKANTLVTESLTPEILRNNAIQKWNGVKSMVSGQNQLILDLTDKR